MIVNSKRKYKTIFLNKLFLVIYMLHLGDVKRSYLKSCLVLKKAPNI
jgi:hypothetical protein